MPRDQVVLAHTFYPRTWDAEAGRSPSLRPAWCTELFQDVQEYTKKPYLGKKILEMPKIKMESDWDERSLMIIERVCGRG